MSNVQDSVPAGIEKGEKETSTPDNASCHVVPFHGTVHELGNVVDPVLNAKTLLVNEAINEIGWTGFHLKLCCLTGFGYAADSLVAFLQSVAASQAYLEIGNGGYPTGSTMALYTGLLFGALFWGFSADVIGRKIAFNTTLFIAAIATVISGAGPNWVGFCVFVAFLGFGAGGNLVLDPTVMLEFVPAKQQWVITAMAGWWGIGQASAGFIAWGYYSRPEWSCTAETESCTWQNNKGWRLVMFTGGALMFVMSALRIVIIRLPETPKYLVASGKEDELVAMLQNLATTYRRPCSLTVDALRACGTTDISQQSGRPAALKGLGKSLVGHVRGLFSTKKLALSTSLIWLSWTLIGLGYPLFFLYLPSLLSSRLPDYSPTFTETWRDYTITNICAIFGPLIAAGLAEVRLLGRRYTMVIGAIITAIFFFCYTIIKTPAQNLAISSCIAVCINLYYGTLYAYTAEVFPSAHRTTGNGIAVALNRIMGLISAVIAVTADTTTVTPLYISAALFLVLAVISVILPFEPYGHIFRSRLCMIAMTSVKSKCQSLSWTKGEFFISTDPTLFPIPRLTEIFDSAEFYWAKSISPDAFREALTNSLSFGIYENTPSNETPSENKLVGIARCVTDYVTFAYLTDVWVDPALQGKGLGSWLICCIREALDTMPQLRRTILMTGNWERSVPFYEKLLDMRLMETKRGEGLAVMERKGKGHPCYGQEGTGYN
ncbi:hypothetical protein FLONG3_4987 [Fusarium longipes]|uniref:Major facilitator superfamily (MFS) profile domain-containing protein n=1 Tax=Fusarium longipes TaxID=694270 RepID=A0A395SWP0_9HYPO|nr:hypothetical protein FLONG3_4987 [Fusarium longipes]